MKSLANAFGNTFVFFAKSQSQTKKYKRAAKPTRQDSSRNGQHSNDRQNTSL